LRGRSLRLWRRETPSWRSRRNRPR
jgi:hypothetical protein